MLSLNRPSTKELLQTQHSETETVTPQLQKCKMGDYVGIRIKHTCVSASAKLLINRTQALINAVFLFLNTFLVRF